MPSAKAVLAKSAISLGNASGRDKPGNGSRYCYFRLERIRGAFARFGCAVAPDMDAVRAVSDKLLQKHTRAAADEARQRACSWHVADPTNLHALDEDSLPNLDERIEFVVVEDDKLQMAVCGKCHGSGRRGDAEPGPMTISDLE